MIQLIRWLFNIWIKEEENSVSDHYGIWVSGIGITLYCPNLFHFWSHPDIEVCVVSQMHVCDNPFFRKYLRWVTLTADKLAICRVRLNLVGCWARVRSSTRFLCNWKNWIWNCYATVLSGRITRTERMKKREPIPPLNIMCCVHC